MAPCLRARTRKDRRHKERISTEGLDFEDLVRFLHDFTKADSFLQLLLPLAPGLCRFGIYGPQTTQSTVVVNGTWIHGAGVCGRLRAGRGARVR